MENLDDLAALVWLLSHARTDSPLTPTDAYDRAAAFIAERERRQPTPPRVDRAF